MLVRAPSGRPFTPDGLDSLPDPLLLVDEHRTVTWLNQAAAALLGDCSLGRCATDVLHITPGGPGPETAAVTDQEGLHHELEVRCTPVPGGVLYSLHDVTALAEISRLREELLYSVAHELRGPLTVLDSALEVLRADYGALSAAEMEDLLRTAGRTAARLQGLMDELLCAGCIRSGRFAIAPRSVPLATLLDDALDAVDLLMDGRGLSILRDPAAAALTVHADPVFARQVVTNLLSNAIKYSPDGGTIHLKVSADGRQARVAVSDEGPGIPEAQRAGLFERFYRPRRPGEQPGIGLGLAIARGIIEAHGGSIDAVSGPGRGTTVWFTLPLAAGCLPAVPGGAAP